MVLQARLAIDAHHQGEGLGRDLLVDAIGHAAAAGARFITVDPIDGSARRFYRRFGFTEIQGDRDGRMYLRIGEALSSFEEAEDDG